MLRQNQKPPKKWSIWLIVAGRGFGKTFAASYTIINLLHKIKNVALIGTTFFDVQNVMVEGPSGLLNIYKKKDYKYSIKNKTLNIGNTVFKFFNEDPEKLRGFEFDLIWIDEWMRFKNPRTMLYQIYLCLRRGISKLIITTTPKNIEILRNLIEDPNVILTTGSSLSNSELSKEFFHNIQNLDSETKFEEIDGQVQSNYVFRSSDIVYKTECDFDYYRIGIDPAIGKGLTGIILIGIRDNNFFVLEDLSTHENPLVWVPKVIELSKQLKLMIIVEANQGGSMLDSLFQSFGYENKIFLVYAKHSKLQRIYQCLFYYKNKSVFHNQKLEKLEEEMLTFPKDRVDALVWSIIFKEKKELWIF